MSQFIELTDYDASIHREILDALTREDESIVEICEDRAVTDMRGYLSRRYDCDKLFSMTGDERNQLVLMMAIFMTKYAVGVMLALHPDEANHAAFGLATSTLYGAFSGAFFGRATRLWRLARRAAQPLVAATA